MSGRASGRQYGLVSSRLPILRESGRSARPAADRLDRAAERDQRRRQPLADQRDQALRRLGLAGVAGRLDRLGRLADRDQAEGQRYALDRMRLAPQRRQVAAATSAGSSTRQPATSSRNAPAPVSASSWRSTASSIDCPRCGSGMGRAWIAPLAPRMSVNERRDNRKRQAGGCQPFFCPVAGSSASGWACGCSKSNIPSSVPATASADWSPICPRLQLSSMKRVIEVWSVSA